MMGSRFCVRSHRKQITSHQARHKASQEGKSLIILSEGGERDGVIYNCRTTVSEKGLWSNETYL